MPVSIGPLGNKQVRVEDSVTVQSASPAGAGTAAIQAVTVDTPGSVVPPGAYWRFSGPEARSDTPGVPVRHYHVWYTVETEATGVLGIDPLPLTTNQIGIKVAVASGMDAETVASTTVIAINAYFAGSNFLSASATRATDDIVVSNLQVGPAFLGDGIGSIAGVAASTSWVFACTPGVQADERTFEVASTIEASAATGASILSLVARHTGSTFDVAADNEITRIVCPVIDTNIIASTAAATFFQLRGPDDSFFLWFGASDGAAASATLPVGSGTGVLVAPLVAGDDGTTVATQLASSINALTQFTATSSATAVTVTGASNGAVVLFASTGAAASGDANASIIITQDQLGGGDWSIDFSNKFPSPAVDLESSRD